MNNIHIVIKLHPGDRSNQAFHLLKDIYDIKNISILFKYDITNLIVACDCMIAEESTTVIEALLLDKPVICVNFEEKQFAVPFFEYEAVYKATNENELKTLLKQILNNTVVKKDYKPFLNDYIYKIDGLSSQRVLNLLYKLTK